MGDISEMMQEGILCQQCGTYIDPEEEGEHQGVPRTCCDCEDEEE